MPFFFFGLTVSSLISLMLCTLASKLILGPSKLLFELTMKFVCTVKGEDEGEE